LGVRVINTSRRQRNEKNAKWQPAYLTILTELAYGKLKLGRRESDSVLVTVDPFTRKQAPLTRA
jgi:hypothetical protein